MGEEAHFLPGPDRQHFTANINQDRGGCMADCDTGERGRGEETVSGRCRACSRRVLVGLFVSDDTAPNLELI